MIKHIVIWNIKEDIDRDEAKNLVKEKLEALSDLVPSLKHIEVGFNYNSSGAAKDICLNSEFETREDLNSYQVHPAHVEAAGYVKSVTCDRIVVDYEV